MLNLGNFGILDFLIRSSLADDLVYTLNTDIMYNWFTTGNGV